MEQTAYHWVIRFFNQMLQFDYQINKWLLDDVWKMSLLFCIEFLMKKGLKFSNNLVLKSL